MRPDPLARPPEKRFDTDDLLRAAVETIANHAKPADSGYERGVIGLVAHMVFKGDWSEAQTAVYDERERIEQNIAEEIEQAEEAVKRAEKRLSEARSRQLKGRSC